MLQVKEIFSRNKGMLDSTPSIERPLNEFLKMCAQNKWEVYKTYYVMDNQNGVIRAAVVEYEAPEPAEEPEKKHGKFRRKPKNEFD